MKVLVIQEGDLYTAVLLEHEVSSYGESAEQAIDRLRWTLQTRRDLAASGYQPIEEVDPAPPEWQSMWDAAKPIAGFEPTDDIASVRLAAA